MNTEIKLTELEQCELTIQTAQGAFLACGNAITKIRDSKLYLSQYSTFEEYCEKRWGWSRRRAYQLIEASGFVNELPKKERLEVKNERQARALIHEEKHHLNQKCVPSVHKTINLDKTGYPIPDGIIEEWNRAESVGREIIRKASELKCQIEKAKQEDDAIFREVTNSAETYAINIYGSLKSILPYCVCTSCQGNNPKKCALCRGRGFFSEFLYKTAVPEEIKVIRSRTIKSK